MGLPWLLDIINKVYFIIYSFYVLIILSTLFKYVLIFNNTSIVHSDTEFFIDKERLFLDLNINIYINKPIDIVNVLTNFYEPTASLNLHFLTNSMHIFTVSSATLFVQYQRENIKSKSEFKLYF